MCVSSTTDSTWVSKGGVIENPTKHRLYLLYIKHTNVILYSALPVMVGRLTSQYLETDIGRRCFPIRRKKMKEVMSMSEYEILVIVLMVITIVVASLNRKN